METRSATRNPQPTTRRPQSPTPNSRPPNPKPISDFIRETESLGFIAAGFSLPEKPLFFDRFRAWIAEGKQGEMQWLERHMDLREDPGKLLEGCRTVITLAYPYSSRKPFTPDGFSASRYAEPDKGDYHDRLRILAKTAAKRIVENYPESHTRVCVDSAPILERSFACAAGIGFIGKNNMLIIPGQGSYVFLAEILTTAPLEFSKAEIMESRCGSCRLCVDACPTGALEGPFRLNASKCLSYLTIEHGGRVDAQIADKMGECFFGCDVCQEVCPFNGERELTDICLPSTDEVIGMQEKVFEERFGKTAFSRAGLEKIKGNIRAVRENAAHPLISE